MIRIMPDGGDGRPPDSSRRFFRGLPAVQGFITTTRFRGSRQRLVEHSLQDPVGIEILAGKRHGGTAVPFIVLLRNRKTSDSLLRIAKADQSLGVRQEPAGTRVLDDGGLAARQ